MPRLIWSQEARDDIVRISEYLEQYDGALAVATLRALADTANLLARFPEMDPVRDVGTRSIRAQRTNYVLVYTLRDDVIAILHIYHDRQDWRPA